MVDISPSCRLLNMQISGEQVPRQQHGVLFRIHMLWEKHVVDGGDEGCVPRRECLGVVPFELNEHLRDFSHPSASLAMPLQPCAVGSSIHRREFGFVEGVHLPT